MTGFLKKRWIPAAALPGLIFLLAPIVQGYLADFSARWDCGWDLIRVRWETVDETDAVGFHLWRSRTRDGIYVRVTENMQAVSGGSGSAVYIYEDENVYRYQVYYYQLEKIRVDGDRVYYEPLRVSPRCEDDDDDNTLIATCFIRSLFK